MTDLSILSPTTVLPGDALVITRGVGQSMVPLLGSLPLASGTPIVAIPASGAAQALAFPVNGNLVYDVSLSANCVFTVSGGVIGQYQVITLILRQGVTGGFVVTLPTGIKWTTLGPPTLRTAANGIDVISLRTPDAGVTLLGGY